MKIKPTYLYLIRPIMARLLMVVSLVIVLQISRAQTVEAFASIDSSSIMIGDQIGMEIGVRLPNGFLVEWPSIGDTVNSHIEILKTSGIDSVVVDNSILLSQRLLITSFDSGYFEIKPFEFHFKTPEDSNSFLANTNTLFLQVSTPVVDTAQAFKAIKGPVEEPYTFVEALPWILLGFGVVALIIAGIWILRRRKKNQPVFARKPKPKLPPHVVAITKYEELRLSKLWQQGLLKPYYTQLTDITREYLENRYHFDALEMTTDEILEACSSHQINDTIRGKLKNVLQLADLVKFAKEKPTALENDLCLNHCIDFVEETKASQTVPDETTHTKSLTENKLSNV